MKEAEKKKKKLSQAEIIAKKKRKIDVEHRFLQRNILAMRFALSNNCTVYPAVQKSGRLKLFIQHHENFKEVSSKTYSQYESSEQMEMVADLDIAYEGFYNKNKHRGFGDYHEVKNSKINNL